MAKQVDLTYGNALFELALEKGSIDSLYEEAKELIGVFRENPELISLMIHPQISKEEKKQIVKNTFDGKASDEITGLLDMVVEKGHFANIIDILNTFVKLVKKEKGIGEVSVVSAVRLNDAQKKAIEAKLIQTTVYKSLEVEYRVDKSIIGGLIIRIEDRVVDSSIKSKLDALSKGLVNA